MGRSFQDKSQGHGKSGSRTSDFSLFRLSALPPVLFAMSCLARLEYSPDAIPLPSSAFMMMPYPRCLPFGKH